MRWYGPGKKKVADREIVEYKNNIRIHRRIRDITQAQLAHKVGVSESTLYQIERRLLMPKLNVAIRLADFFEVPVRELFFLPNEEPKLRLTSE